MSNVKKYKKGTRTVLTKNFASTEFDCKCKNLDCEWTLIDIEHVEKLQKLRSKWNKPIRITSAYRCVKHNKAVGGSTNSRHIAGDATDIVVPGMTLEQLALDCEDFNGLGKYNTFLHIDSRPLGCKAKARWDFRKNKKV